MYLSEVPPPPCLPGTNAPVCIASRAKINSMSVVPNPQWVAAPELQKVMMFVCNFLKDTPSLLKTDGRLELLHRALGLFKALVTFGHAGSHQPFCTLDTAMPLVPVFVEVCVRRAGLRWKGVV